jgi:hypothetical protein
MLFSKYPNFISFQWKQLQDYNDEYMVFDLDSFVVNEASTISIYGFNWLYDDSWDFVLFDVNEEDSLIVHKLRSNFSINELITPLREPVMAIIIFLKAHYDLYKPYYFIYLFGFRSVVHISSKGITIRDYESQSSNS